MTLDKESLFESWLNVKSGLGYQATDFAAWTFHAIADGHGPTIDDAAAALDFDPDKTEEVVERLKEAGVITTKGEHVTGAMGLTTEQTSHSLDLDGRKLHTWCALDAAGIPAALGRSAVIDSQTADDDSAVHLTYKAREYAPATAYEIFVPTPDANESIVEEACPAINFYHAGRAPTHPLARALSLEEVVELARLIWPAEPPREVAQA